MISVYIYFISICPSLYLVMSSICSHLFTCSICPSPLHICPSIHICASVLLSICSICPPIHICPSVHLFTSVYLFCLSTCSHLSQFHLSICSCLFISSICLYLFLSSSLYLTFIFTFNQFFSWFFHSILHSSSSRTAKCAPKTAVSDHVNCLVMWLYTPWDTVGIVTTYEQEEDKLPVLVFGTEQVNLWCSPVK